MERKSMRVIIEGLIISLVLLCPIAFASPSGSCGPDAVWTLDKGILTISGTGEVDEFDGWKDYRNDIKEVIIQEGRIQPSPSALLNPSPSMGLFSQPRYRLSG